MFQLVALEKVCEPWIYSKRVELVIIFQPGHHGTTKIDLFQPLKRLVLVTKRAIDACVSIRCAFCTAHFLQLSQFTKCFLSTSGDRIGVRLCYHSVLIIFRYFLQFPNTLRKHPLAHVSVTEVQARP